MDLNKVFKALGDEHRRIILEELLDCDRQSLFTICARLSERHGLSITRQGVSRHLDALEEAELIRIEWEGRTKMHSLNRSLLKKIGRGWLAKFEEAL